MKVGELVTRLYAALVVAWLCRVVYAVTFGWTMFDTVVSFVMANVVFWEVSVWVIWNWKRDLWRAR